MAIDTNMIDRLLKEYKTPEEILGENGLIKQLTKAVVERAMQAEMSNHLGYDKYSPAGKNSGNSRNGKYSKTLTGEHGEMKIDVPRDRNAEFEPVIVPKGQTRFDGFDDKIISMYARGMTTREIRGHLEEIYGVEVSPALISTVTEEVMEEVKIWQNRPLDAVYPILYLDALYIKIKDDGHILNKAVYLAMAVNMEGQKELLGMWIAKTEGAKFWLNVLTEMKNRGVKDFFIVCVDGLTGFAEAIETAYPQAQVQRCIVHMIRHSLKFVSWKQRKEVAADLKSIYQAKTADEAEFALEEFAEKWDKQYPMISKSWRNSWQQISTFFAYPQEIRKAIYTTNAIESLNMSLRKVTKNRAAFPSDDAAIKLLYLALRNISKKWTMPIKDWKAALSRFTIVFEGRVPMF
jgi:putative transposase